MLAFLEKEITENFTQLQGQGETLDGTVLVSKKGKITVKAKNHPVKEKSENSGAQQSEALYFKRRNPGSLSY